MSSHGRGAVAANEAAAGSGAECPAQRRRRAGELGRTRSPEGLGLAWRRPRWRRRTCWSHVAHLLGERANLCSLRYLPCSLCGRGGGLQS